MRSTRATDERDRSRDLHRAIERTGYYPEVVADAVDGAVAGEEVVSYFVHHEPTFERDEVRRHVTVLVLTPTRLILAHTDEHAPDDLLPAPRGEGRTPDEVTDDELLAAARTVVERLGVGPAGTLDEALDLVAGDWLARFSAR